MTARSLPLLFAGALLAGDALAQSVQPPAPPVIRERGVSADRTAENLIRIDYAIDEAEATAAERPVDPRDAGTGQPAPARGSVSVDPVVPVDQLPTLEEAPDPEGDDP